MMWIENGLKHLTRLILSTSPFDEDPRKEAVREVPDARL